MQSIVQFGAGNIGRSLVGQLFAAAGYEVVFVDPVGAIVDALNARRSYPVVIKDTLPPGAPSEVVVRNVRGIHAGDADGIEAALAACDLASTAVGAAALPNVLPLLARAAARRTTALNVLLCENLRDAAQLARTRMTELCPHGVVTPAFIATSIGKMVPLMPESVRAKDPLVVWAEAYNQIIADADAFVGIPPAVPGLVLKHNFDAYVDCKLFVHNLGHAAAAYFGFLAGKTHIWECMADASVRMPVERVMHEAGRALLWRYSQELTADALAGHIEDLLRRFENRALGDSVFRVGRDLPRKLAPGDRCIGALRLIQSAGGDIDAVCAVIAAALRFAARDEHGEPFAADTAVRMRVAEDGVADVLTTVCGLAAERDADVIARISAAYTNMPDRATPATDRQPQATADGAGSV